jgi:hypothetical protein
VNRQDLPQAGATLNQDVVPAGPEPSPRVPNESRGVGAGAAERESETPLILASTLNHDLSPPAGLVGARGAEGVSGSSLVATLSAQAIQRSKSLPGRIV